MILLGLCNYSTGQEGKKGAITVGPARGYLGAAGLWLGGSHLCPNSQMVARNHLLTLGCYGSY